jgi:hypothetical protein
MSSHETRDLEQGAWLPFFDSISSGLRGKAADITISTPSEHIHQSRCWQLHGLTYDPYDRALIVSCQQQEHVIAAPKAIRVESHGQTIHSVEVIKDAGEREIIRFIDPLLLPAM